MTAIIFDTETTGLDAPELIEAAWMRIDIAGVGSGGECRRYRPSKPISLGALATHHIMDEDLVDCPPASAFTLPEGVDYLIGYNIDFDWRVIGQPNIKRIDVLAMCRRLWPDADAHSQGAMLYALDRVNARAALTRAHSAAADIINCRTILLEVMRKAGPFADFEALWQASEGMRIPMRMPYGKHRGAAIRDIPTGYRSWLLNQADVDPYLAIALRTA